MFGAAKRKAARELRQQREDAEREARYERLREEALRHMRPEQVRTGPIPRDVTTQEWLAAREKWIKEQETS